MVGIIGLSVGFASLSTVLNITGTGTVQSSKWDIHFDNLSAADTGNTTAEEITHPTEAATSLTDYSVKLQRPGDYVKYTFDVVNDGTYDAKISTISIPTPHCTGNGTNATNDAANVCKYLTYTLTYDDVNNTPVATNDSLTVTEKSKKLVLTLVYDKENAAVAAELPKDDVSISDLDISITYVQK